MSIQISDDAEFIRFAVRQVLSPVKTHGGKKYLARDFLPLIPRRKIYLEPFAGGANLLLNIAPGMFERRILNDLNPKLIAVYLALQNQPEVFLQKLRRLEYNKETFLAAKARDEARPSRESVSSEALIETAVDFFTRNRMPRGGTGQSFAWSDRHRGGQPGDVNAWKSMVHKPGGLERIIGILQGVEIHCGDGIELLRSYSEDRSVVGYLDPPYPHSTRTVKNAYGKFEMSMAQHQQLAEVANGASCAIAISSYLSREYLEWYQDWTLHEFEMACHAGQTDTKTRRIEVLWLNRHRW